MKSSLRRFARFAANNTKHDSSTQVRTLSSASFLNNRNSNKNNKWWFGGAAGVALASGSAIAFADSALTPDDPLDSESVTSPNVQSQKERRAKLAADAAQQQIHAHRAQSMKIFAGSANVPLAREIAQKLGTQLGEISVKTFADGEIGIQVHENVRGKDVYIIQPTCPPDVNDHLVELILMISTMRRASARRITAVIPYYGYARQDRKMQSRVPISAADVARLLESMGVDRVVAVDLHCGQIQGFFGPRTPCDNLEGAVVALPYFSELQNLSGDSTVIISPDAGGVHRAKKFRDGLSKHGIDAGLAMIIKQRSRANQIESMDLVGDVEGMDCIIVDDMIDTAGTLCKAGAELKRRGARDVYAFATHGLFSGPAIDRIRKSDFEKVVVCDTIPLSAKDSIDKIHQLPISGLLAEAIARIHFKKSVSELFKGDRHKMDAKNTVNNHE